MYAFINTTGQGPKLQQEKGGLKLVIDQMKVIKLKDLNKEQTVPNIPIFSGKLVSKRGFLLTFVLFAIFSIQSVFNKNHASIAFAPKVLPMEEKKYSSFLQAGDKIIKTIIIDAGHGGKDPGCIGHGNVYEKDIALDIALKFGKLIQDSIKGVKVIYTRKTDKFIELYQRAAIANTSSADIFISIHCNYNPVTKLNGFESYIMGTHKTTANLEVSKRENESILFEKDYRKRSAC